LRRRRCGVHHCAPSQWAVSFGDNPVVALDAGRLKLLRKALIVRKAMSASACFTAAATGSMTGTRI